MNKIKAAGLTPVTIEGAERNVIGVTGNTASLDIRQLRADKTISEVLRVSEPYKLANRSFHPDNTQIQVDDQIIGGERLAIMAGPCSVEGEEEIISIAKRMKLAGANFLRGGAFKPRTSPYSFQGLELEGLRLLQLAKRETGLPIVSELMSAEYIMSEGNPNVILCERGIRTFETETRNALDIQAVPVMKKKTHLPIIVDPSHAAGQAYLVPAGAKAGVAAGADGLMIETHADPENAWSDGEQSLTPDEFDKVMEQIAVLAQVEGRTVPEK